MSGAGRKNAAYYNTGTYATPVWALLSRITEVARPSSRATSDRKFRGARNVKTVTGYRKYGLTFKYAVKKGGATDAVEVALQASFDDETVVDLVMVNQPMTAATTPPIGTTYKGIRGPFVVTKFDRDEADEDGTTYDVEMMEVDEDVPSSTTLWEVIAFSGTVA